MQKILITGGAGFIGQALVNRLWESHDITIYDNLLAQVHGYLSAEERLKLNVRANFIWGDVCTKNQFEDVLSESDIIIHLAAETGTAQSMTQIDRYFRANTAPMAILSDYIVNSTNSISKVILASSRAVYGEGIYDCNKCGLVYPHKRDLGTSFLVYCPICNNTDLRLIPIKENAIVNPVSVYGMTKLMQEQILNITTNCSFILRLQNVYGVGQSLINPHTGIINHFAKLALKNEMINIYEDGEIYRDFVFIDDVVEAFEKCIDYNNIIHNVTLNIGSGTGISLMKLAKFIVDYYGSKSSIITSGQFREGDIKGSISNNSLAEKLINYKSIFTLEEGLPILLDWIRDNA